MIKYAIFCIEVRPRRDCLSNGFYYYALAMLSLILEKSFVQQKDKDKEFQQG